MSALNSVAFGWWGFSETTFPRLPIQSMDALDAFCAAQQPAAAVLCLPKESAQTVAERLVSLGVRGLWNFSHCDLAVENAQVVTMHLDDSLMTLSYKLHNL